MGDERYLRALLVPHPDFSFTWWPTGLFVFHCLHPSPDDGGASILVDGFPVADRLRRKDPGAFELLSTLRQRFCGSGSVKFDWRAAFALPWPRACRSPSASLRTLCGHRIEPMKTILGKDTDLIWRCLFRSDHG